MKYICQICGYIYDDDKEKVPFKELPESWKCPLCGAVKADFKPEGIHSEVQIIANEKEAELKELTFGQLAALCSNLARGCEKQYRAEESKLFLELAEYFTLMMPPVQDPTVEKITQLLQKDIEQYPIARATADAANDRGTARICVWGEKVTRMLASLMNRYMEEGEAMLEETNVWVCTTCGFVYVGDAAPEVCPVCKVPSWKFEKIEGRA